VKQHERARRFPLTIGYRIHLEQRKYGPATINLPLAAVRRIASEAAQGHLPPNKLLQPSGH
jgi:hypothetical protein